MSAEYSPVFLSPKKEHYEKNYEKYYNDDTGNKIKT
jgi:hypothetical protein